MNKKGEIGKEGENTSSPYQGEVPARLRKGQEGRRGLSSHFQVIALNNI
jgi:hypothetical protein